MLEMFFEYGSDASDLFKLVIAEVVEVVMSDYGEAAVDSSAFRYVEGQSEI